MGGLRVGSGRFKGRSLDSQKGLLTRPTAARAKEGLFNVLRQDLEGVYFGDFFAGSGGIGIEALSNGAKKVDFYESHPRALQALQENLRRLSLPRESSTLFRKALPASIMEGPPYDIVFLDPPWGEFDPKPVLLALLKKGRLNTKSLMVLESRKGMLSGKPDVLPDGFQCVQTKRYGEAEFHFYHYIGDIDMTLDG